MLDHEYDLLIERLNAVRGGRTAFFVFADTVAALRALGAPTKPMAGWVRFQSEPAECHILHVRMWDKENVLQHQALGIVGDDFCGPLFSTGDNRLMSLKQGYD